MNAIEIKGKVNTALCYATIVEDIIDVIRASVEIIDVMKPIYNFKAAEK